MTYNEEIMEINQLLIHHLQSIFPWDNFSNDSNTQNDERNYIKIVSNVIQKMGGKIGSFAPSQQSKDIRDVIFPGAPHAITYECKKSKGVFILNDTVPHPDDDYYVRPFTVCELQQIQGFPIDYKLAGNLKEQIVQIGNSIPPKLVEEIVRRLKF